MLNSVGIFAFTYLQVGLHRAVEYSKESQQPSETLILSGSEFASMAWVGERDFIFNGKVYDCEQISSANGKIHLVCHSDAEETNLKNSLADNLDNGEKNAPTSKPIKDFFKIFPVFQSLIESNELVFTANSIFHYSIYSKQVPASAELSLNSPPPKFS